MNREYIQRKLELITGKWWFFLLFILMQFIIPPYASKGFDWSEIGWITGEVLSNSIVYTYPGIFPIFKIIPIILVISIIYFRKKAGRLFNIYVALTYVLFALLQNIAITEKYGLGIITINLIMFILVAAFWFWEAIVQKNDFTPLRIPAWRYWVIPMGFLAFWYPCNISGVSAVQDFNPIHFLTNEAGLTFCMMTPVYLSILSIFHPKVNIATMRVTGLVGVIIGFYNVLVNFFISPGLWWNGVLHMPLLTISIYALGLSFKNVNPLIEP